MRNTLTGITLGQQGAGGQAPISRPICNITLALQAEGTTEEKESMEESDAGSTIPSNSDDPDDQENNSEDPEELTEEMKKEILNNYLKEKQKAK